MKALPSIDPPQSASQGVLTPACAASRIASARRAEQWTEAVASFSLCEALSSPSEDSCSVLLRLMEAMERSKGASKGAKALRELMAGAALRMFEAGWAGPALDLKRSERIWELVIGSARVDLAQAAVDCGLRPWTPVLHWSLSPIGLAMNQGRLDTAVCLARAMNEAEVAAALKSRNGLLFDVLHPGKWDKVGEGLGDFWQAWSPKGLPIDARDGGPSEGRTVLMEACWMTRSVGARMIASLLEWGASPRLADEDGRTPLHFVCAEGEPGGYKEDELLAAARALIAAGADPMARDSRGLTPIDIARAARWDAGVAELSAFESKEGLAAELDAGEARLGRALKELRRGGFSLLSPDGAQVGWDEALQSLAGDGRARSGARPGVL